MSNNSTSELSHDVFFSEIFESAEIRSGRVVTTTNTYIPPITIDLASPLCSSNESARPIEPAQEEVLILMVIKNRVTAWGSDGLLSDPELVLFRAADRVLEKTLGFGD